MVGCTSIVSSAFCTRFGRHARGGNRREGMGERTRHLIRATAVLQLAPVPHGGVFFGNVQKLQPDADDLQRVLDQVGAGMLLAFAGSSIMARTRGSRTLIT